MVNRHLSRKVTLNLLYQRHVLLGIVEVDVKLV
jgi:hypothetical protein